MTSTEGSLRLIAAILNHQKLWKTQNQRFLPRKAAQSSRQSANTSASDKQVTIQSSLDWESEAARSLALNLDAQCSDSAGLSVPRQVAALLYALRPT